MSQPKEAVEFMDGESAFLKVHATTTHGQAKVTAVGNAPGLLLMRPPKSAQPPGSDVILVVNDRQYSNTL